MHTTCATAYVYMQKVNIRAPTVLKKIAVGFALQEKITGTKQALVT